MKLQIPQNDNLYYWMKIGKYVRNKDKIDTLHFLYNQCKLYH
jgi:hypothetical protein